MARRVQAKAARAFSCLADDRIGKWTFFDLTTGAVVLTYLVASRLAYRSNLPAERLEGWQQAVGPGGVAKSAGFDSAACRPPKKRTEFRVAWPPHGADCRSADHWPWTALRQTGQGIAVVNQMNVVHRIIDAKMHGSTIRWFTSPRCGSDEASDAGGCCRCSATPRTSAKASPLPHGA